MNLTAFLSRFVLLGFHAQQGHARVPALTAALPQRRTMARHAIVELENRRLQLRVLRGWVWITRDGCLADTVLGAGDVFEQQPGARVLVQAFEETELFVAGAEAHAHND